jgi:hypothetical protein
MWSEAGISKALVYGLFQRAVLCVPNCRWTGHECDLLIIHKSLRIIDVEIKIDRADLKVDAFKDKWLHGQYSSGVRPRRDWPMRVWRHYYVVPANVWTPDLLGTLGSSYSGIVTIKEQESGMYVNHVVRRARSNPHAAKLTSEQVIDIARLAGLRLWRVETGGIGDTH